MSKNKPLVSVVIPTYNRATLLPKAINSVLNQTFQDFEIIVSDDSSTDNTRKAVEGFRDSRVKYFLKTRNPKGGAANLNEGIKKSKGEYIAILDDDDEWLPDKLEKQLEIFSKNPGTVLVHSGEIIIKDGKEITKPGNRIKGKVGLKDFAFKGITTSTTIIKSGPIKKELFDENLSCAYDRDLWIRLSKYGKMEFCPENLIKYYVHGGNISSKTKSRIESEEYFIKKYNDDLKKNNVMGIFLFRLGVLYSLDKNSMKARESLAKAVKMNPEFRRARIYYILSVISTPLLRKLIIDIFPRLKRR